MAYAMRFNILVRTVTTPGTADDGDPTLARVGDTTTDSVNPIGGGVSLGAGLGFSAYTYATPTGPVIVSETAAASAGVSVCSKLQKSLHFNVRFEVWGQPVGFVESGNTDLTSDQKALKLYIQGDTPSAGLIYAIIRANRKARRTGHSVYDVPYAQPEVGAAETTEPS